MTNAKLEKWTQLLLDLGKNNNLINFKDRKSSTVEFILPDSDVLFNKLSGDTRIEVYNPKLDDDDFEWEEESRDQKEFISRDDYIYKYGARLKRNQVLPYCSYFSPIKAIKNINKKAKTAIEETGVNIAYVAFGFIHWTEKEDSNAEYKAPILLIPVAIKKESSVAPYFISSSDDEVTVNPTFSYKLSSEFNIQLPDYEGQELSAYLSTVESIVEKLNWTVTSEAKLGIFSFLKINMYRDLQNNADKILKNGNIRGMMGEPCRDFDHSQSKAEPADSNPPVFYNVVDADSSQLEAVKLAKSGRSFVLQGPPGTGKSQTITNIIAECLMDGKKVLFVSEKLAALEVVYDKLKKAGLDEFCLQLHSYKANKKDVISDLERTLKLEKSVVSAKAENELAALEKAKAQLDSYEKELHQIRDVINLSLYGLYEKHAAYRKYKDVDYIIPAISQNDETNLDAATDQLDKYAELTASIGQNYKLNCWYGYLVTDASYGAAVNAKSQLGDIINVMKNLKNIADTIKASYNIDVNNLEQIEKVVKLFKVLGKSEFILPKLLSVKSADRLIDSVNKMQALSKDIKANKGKLASGFNDDIYKLDGGLMYKKFTQQYNNIIKRLFSSEYRMLANNFKLCSNDGKRLKYSSLCNYSQILYSLQSAQASFAANEQKTQDSLNVLYKGLDTDWEYIINQLKDLSTCIKDVDNVGTLNSFETAHFIGERKSFAEIYKTVSAILRDNNDLINEVFKSFDSNIFNIKTHSFDGIISKLNSCLKNFDTRNNWIIFNKLLNEMQLTGIKSFVDFCIDKNISSDVYSAIYKKNFYKQWIDYVIHSSDILSEFNRLTQDKAVSTFAQKDKLQFEINKAKIKQTLSAVRPDMNFVANGSSVSILLREAQKKRKQKPIRQLLGEIADLAQMLKPCFMMSPLSVSTFLDSDKISFDTVVFDEASQIFPQDAIGAIYRGKQVIVVGDSKQMPPSNFFNAITGSDEYDDEDEDIADFESILDLCSTTMPQLRLKWHYRSRFEELISFSNKNFYDGDLISFPSAQKKALGIGVDYYHVNGVFDRRTKTNREEAEFIAGLVFKHFEEYPQRSLGVVAFSASQQDLIEKCISRRRQADSSKEEFFKADNDEPFFVKNLETVQGDERDTIIFSMAYARDVHGRFMANFGPVNRVGGERRLNVAVTRAKYNVQFVASVHSNDVDLKGSQSVGAKLLRDYLDFAENGMVALERSENANLFEQSDFDFERDICEFLTKKGFKLDSQVGCSKFKIDLALKKPDASDYLLAIECDGASYHSYETTRDRDRLRQQILENMGWKFYRIWSTDWFKNNRVEKERLLTAASEAIKAGGSNKPVKQNKAPKEINFIETKPSVELSFPYYKTVSVNSAWEESNGNFIKMLKKVLAVEAPLSEEWLLKRSVYLFGREKITNVVTNSYEYQMRNCKSYGIIRRNGFLYLEGQNVPMLRIPDCKQDLIREIKYICLEELANGMREVIKHNVTISKDGLYKEIATQLGFTRMGDAITARLNEAFQFLSKELKIIGDTISLK